MIELYNRLTNVAYDEMCNANKIHELFHSRHEALGVIAEEIHESEEALEMVLSVYHTFQEHVFNDVDYEVLLRDVNELSKRAVHAASELIQVSAMARKFTISEGTRDVK